jgi:hypothetical protein
MTTLTDTQTLRQSALKWQLMALHAQVGALRTLSEEHNFSLGNLQPDNIYKRVEDALATARQLADSMSAQTLAERLHSIQSFKECTDQLRADADAFCKLAEQRASMRLQATITSLVSNAGEETAPTDDSDAAGKAPALPLLNEANHSCFQAESGQYQTFVLQLNATCDLALEMLFIAAAYGSAFTR